MTHGEDPRFEGDETEAKSSPAVTSPTVSPQPSPPAETVPATGPGATEAVADESSEIEPGSPPATTGTSLVDPADAAPAPTTGSPAAGAPSEASGAPTDPTPPVEPPAAPVSEEPMAHAPEPEPEAEPEAAPVSEDPLAHDSGPEAAPVSEEPVGQEAEPVSEEPVAHDSEPEPGPEAAPVSEEPVAEEPGPEAAPVPDEPVSEEPVAHDSEPEPEPGPEAAPVSEEPAAQEPEGAVAATVSGGDAPGPTTMPPAPPPGAGPVGRPPAPGTPPRPPRPTGRVVEGVVTAVSSDEVELTLDDGRPAVINRRNFGPNDEDPTTVLSVGDRAFGAELAREDPKARVVLSRAWALKKLAWERVLTAASTKSTLSGKVTSVGAKGVVVDVGLRGFVPTSHLELEPVKDLAPYQDQVLELKVLEADPQRERLVLSRRSLLLKEQRKKAQELLARLKPGESCRGRVTSITNYGAFVDLGGVNGLVHLSELSWRRIRKPNDVVSLGDEVEVRILDVKAKKRRVSLSLRQMRPDPLTELEVGQIYHGPVTRLVDFGAFVALGEVEGLVHLSELAEYRVSTPEEVVTPGEEVGVKVLSIDPKRRRVELSIRQAAEFGG